MKTANTFPSDVAKGWGEIDDVNLAEIFAEWENLVHLLDIPACPASDLRLV